MAVGDADDLQESLQRAVLARPAVQEVERDIGFHGREHRGDVAADVDAGDPVAEPRERVGAGPPRPQRDVALGRPASHQDRDVLAHAPRLRRK